MPKSGYTADDWAWPGRMDEGQSGYLVLCSLCGAPAVAMTRHPVWWDAHWALYWATAEHSIFAHAGQIPIYKVINVTKEGSKHSHGS